MENAIKALLIAAGVLVAILVISIGIMIITNSSSTQEAGATMSELEITQFNRKYEQYEGIRSGNTVKTLLGYVMEDNEYKGSERDHKTGINLRSNVTELINAFPGNPQMKSGLTDRAYGVIATSSISAFRDKVSTTKKYKVWFSYNSYGLVHEIHIDDPY